MQAHKYTFTDSGSSATMLAYRDNSEWEFYVFVELSTGEKFSKMGVYDSLLSWLMEYTHDDMLPDSLSASIHVVLLNYHYVNEQL